MTNGYTESTIKPSSNNLNNLKKLNLDESKKKDQIDNEHKCNECGQLFKNKSKLICHIFEVHFKKIGKMIL